MPVTFNLTSRTRSTDNIRKVDKSHQRKTFVYSTGRSDLNFNEMYEDLNPNIALLVQENRLKLNSMNCTLSKMLVNTTQMKLVAFMRSKPFTRKHHTMSSTQRTHKSNIYMKSDDQKQNHQQIFDFNKLEQIIKTYQKNTNKSKVKFSGALTQKVLKLTGQRFYAKPETTRIDFDKKLESTQTQKNYMGWKAEKSRRRLKHMFV